MARDCIASVEAADEGERTRALSGSVFTCFIKFPLGWTARYRAERLWLKAHFLKWKVGALSCAQTVLLVFCTVLLS